MCAKYKGFLCHQWLLSCPKHCDNGHYTFHCALKYSFIAHNMGHLWFIERLFITHSGHAIPFKPQ